MLYLPKLYLPHKAPMYVCGETTGAKVELVTPVKDHTRDIDVK